MKRGSLERMQAYEEASSCRRELLLQYFGDDFSAPCGDCDVCEAGEAADPEVSGAGTRREVV